MLSYAVTWVGLVALSALIVRIMIGAGKIDLPGPRSSHSTPTPKGGGVGIVIAFTAGLALLAAQSELPKEQAIQIAALGIAACGLAVVAFLDDLLDWSFSAKLAAQLAASAALLACGYELADFSLPWIGPVHAGLLGLPLAILWIVAATNAMNFMDGLNGLASGVSLVACLAIAASTRNGTLAVLPISCLALAAGLIGFLPFNFPRARIFMGDVGSQPCGLVIAALGLLVTAPASGAGTPFLVPMLLSGLLFDAALTLVRRSLRGARLTQAHREHLYQLAHRAGMPAAAISAIHWGMTAWGGICAKIASHQSGTALPVALALLALPQIAWLGFVTFRCRKAEIIL